MLRADKTARPFRFAGGLFLVAVLALVPSGCTRPHYRNQADEVGGTLMRRFGNEAGQPAVDTRWRPPAGASRLYDPLDPDFPPMPPDDPLAHTRMHKVDGMKAFNWHKYPSTPVVDDGHWLACLPYDEQGRITLDMEGAVMLAFLHSREYRKELEDLYLSALDVSFERFRFAAQFFAGNATSFTADGRDRPGGGGQSSSVLETDSFASAEKLYAAGGQLVVD